MPYAIIAALIFGLVHPGSKLLMGQGLDLLAFCTLYVFIRLLAQVPWVIKTKGYKITSARSVKLLITIGVVGACLQLSEFVGISRGLPVPVVIFLVYTHTIWSLIFSVTINKQPLDKGAFVQLAAGLAGMFFIVGSEWSVNHIEPMQLLLPMFAGLFIALWVSLTNKAKEEGASIWNISFYYDLFALLSLVMLRLVSPSMPLKEMAHWLMNPAQGAAMCLYAVVVGTLPNLLFYKGSGIVGARAAAFVLLFEPVIASLLSHFIWQDDISALFALGAVCILFASLPLKYWKLPAWPRLVLSNLS